MKYNLHTQTSPLGSANSLVLALEARLAPFGEGRFVRVSGNDVAYAGECEGLWAEARLRPSDESNKQQLLVALVRLAARMHVVWMQRGHDLPAHILVDAALTRLREASHRGARWLAEASVADEAEVLLWACDRVDRFQRDFPEWPMGSPVRVEAVSVRAGEGLLLIGNPDLAFGSPPSPNGDGLYHPCATSLTLVAPEESPQRVEARVRFDQLVEALRFGGPPKESLIWDPESGDLTLITASQDSLAASVEAAGITAARLRRMLAGYDPTLTPGDRCDRCPRFLDCPEWHDV